MAAHQRNEEFALLIVVFDTSGLIAALDQTHPDNEMARQVPNDAGTIVVSPLVLGELDHVDRRVLGRRAIHQAIDDIAGWSSRSRAVIPEVTPAILATAQAVRERYGDLQLDLTGAVLVAVASEFHTDAILTLDRGDFRVVCPLTAHRAFLVLPADLENPRAPA